jgi:hypothetical protein
MTSGRNVSFCSFWLGSGLHLQNSGNISLWVSKKTFKIKYQFCLLAEVVGTLLKGYSQMMDIFEGL